MNNKFDFANDIICLLLEDENGDLYELKDTGNYKVYSQFEKGKIFKKKGIADNKKFTSRDMAMISKVIHRAIVDFSTVGKKTTISEDLLLQKIEGTINASLNFLNDNDYWERMGGLSEMSEKRFEVITNVPDELGIRENRSGDVIVLKHRDLNSEQFVGQIVMFLNDQNDTIIQLVEDARQWEKTALARIKELEKENETLKVYLAQANSTDNIRGDA